MRESLAMQRPDLDRLASLDPTGLASRGIAAARWLLEPTSNGAGPEPLPAPHADPGPADAARPAQAMDDLLQRSMFQTPAESLEALAALVVREIVPDEARIIAALADGHAYPLMHVEIRDRSRATRRVFANASSVGRAAGVALPASTPTYLHHLLGLGLVEEGPEDPELRDEYSILSTDAAVRQALTDAEASGRSQRLVKRTVRMSQLGTTLWAVWRPADQDATGGITTL